MTTQPDKGTQPPPASAWAAFERAIDNLRRLKEQQEQAAQKGGTE